MKKYFLILPLFIILTVPFFVFAQPAPEPLLYGPGAGNNLAPYQGAVAQNTSFYSGCYTDMNDLGDMLCRIASLINSAIPVLVALGVVYFVWGVVQYMIGQSDEAKTRGKDKIIYGIIGFAVIAMMWGLVALVINTFGIGNDVPNINLMNFTVQNNNGATSSGALCSLGSNPKLQNLLGYASCIITRSVIPLIFALALASFVWGVVQFFIINSGEEAKREQGRQFMLWGIIALTVMVCVWGLVAIVGRTFNIENAIPQVKGK